MDLKKHLRDRNLKWNWDAIAKYCIENPASIAKILDYCTDEEIIIQQNAGAVLGKLIDHDKQVLYPYQQRFIAILSQNPHDAVKRGMMRVYQWLAIDEEIEGELFDYIIKYLANPEEAIAIKAFGMTVARRICEKYPELANELLPYVETLVQQKVSAGVSNRGKKEMKILNALI